MIEPSIHIDETRKTVTFVLEADFHHIFSDESKKRLFFNIQESNMSISEKLTTMAKMFEEIGESYVEGQEPRPISNISE